MGLGWCRIFSKRQIVDSGEPLREPFYFPFPLTLDTMKLAILSGLAASVSANYLPDII